VDFAWYQSKDAQEILVSGGSGPHDFIKAKRNSDWPRTGAYSELGKIPRIMAHNGRYLLKEATGAGLSQSGTGSRADVGSYGVWLSYFGATQDLDMTQELLDPLIRYDDQGPPSNEQTCESSTSSGAGDSANDPLGYSYGTDGWLVDDGIGGIYWRIHDQSYWRADYDYFSNTWAWLGLALYQGGYIVNSYDNPNSGPSSIMSIKLKNSFGEYVPAIDDTKMTVEIKGVDINPDKVDFVYVSIKSSDGKDFPKKCGLIAVKCAETTKNSGVYRGSFRLGAFSNDARDEIGGQTGSKITFTVGPKSRTVTVAEITFGNKTLVDACNHTKGMANNLGGYWYEALDTNEGHLSTGTMTFPPDGVSGNSVRFDYQLLGGPTHKPDTIFALLGTQMTPNGSGSNDLSGYTGISFYLRGSDKQVTVVLKSQNVTDYNYYQYTIDTTPGEWRQYVLKFADFSQEAWGTQVPMSETLSTVTDLHFKASSKVDGEEGWFEIDNIDLLGTP
jgi:hypothetical protein